MINQCIDPRDDLTDDHSIWEALLSTQFARDGGDTYGLYGVLLGFRAEGCRLVIDRGRLRIEPGEEIETEYPALRSTWLLPRRDELTALLTMVASRLTSESNPTETLGNSAGWVAA